MADILPKHMKDHDALVRVRATRSVSPSDVSSPRSEWSRGSSFDLKRSRKFEDTDDYSFSDYSFFSDSPLKEKFQQPPPLPARRRTRSRQYIFLILLAIGTTIIFTFIVTTTIRSKSTPKPPRTVRSTNSNDDSYFSSLYKTGRANPGTFPYELAGALPKDRCSICNCDVTPNYYDPSPELAAEYAPRARHNDIYLSQDSVDLNEFMRQTLLDIYCSRQHLDYQQSYKLARRTGNNLHEMMSWSLGSLELGKPTVYLTTATSPNGKAGEIRPQYMRRSGREIRSWLKQQESKAKSDRPSWQVIWIIAEDEVDIDPQLVSTLRKIGVPYVYFGYGLTKSWGNAQKNAVMQVAHALSRPKEHGGIFGHGPVYGLDDDNKMMPGLLDMLVKVERIGVLPVGNLGAYGFEEPIVDSTGLVVGSGSIWQPASRKFAFDYGGFSFNTSLLSTQISGPMFWKHQDFAGESEFISQIVNKLSEIEPLCGRQELQDCHHVWHNEALLQIETLSDDEELEFIQKNGVDKYYQTLESQQRDRDASRAANYVRPDGIKPGMSMEGIPEMTEDGVGVVWVEVQA